jgi:hypothetical protein
MAAEPEPDDPVARWRHEHARAVERFLAGLIGPEAPAG